MFTNYRQYTLQGIKLPHWTTAHQCLMTVKPWWILHYLIIGAILIPFEFKTQQAIGYCIDMMRWWVWDEWYAPRVLCLEHCLWQGLSENSVLFYIHSANERIWREIWKPNGEPLKPFIKNDKKTWHWREIPLARPCITSKWWAVHGVRLVLVEVFYASVKAGESGCGLSLSTNDSMSVSSPFFSYKCGWCPFTSMVNYVARSEMLWSTLQLLQ